VPEYSITNNLIAAANAEINQAKSILNEIVSWVDAETHNVVFGTRAQFLVDRGAI
jgi:hypothetical protein